MDFDKVFTVKTKFTKDEFLRETLIYLSKKADTPLDILKSKFFEVKESTVEVAIMSAHIETDYAASIGYKRKETYLEKSPTTGELVEKTREVTDWKPFSGHASGDQKDFCFNDEKNNRSPSRKECFRIVFDHLDDEDLLPEGSTVLLDSTVQSLEFLCKLKQEFSIKFPGDEHKDQKYFHDLTVNEVSCLIVPKYTIDYEYNGKYYTAESYACGLLSVYSDSPVRNDKIEDQASEQTKKTKKTMLAGWISFGALFVLAAGLLAANIYWGCVFPMIALVAAIILNIKSDKEYNRKLAELTNGSSKIKLAALEAKLSEINFTKLSENEKKSFDYSNDAFVSLKGKNTVKKTTIICSIAMVILIVTSIILGVNTHSKAIHSPDNVNVSVIAKSEEAGYGDSYVYYTYEITNNTKNIDIDGIYLTLYVYESGAQIGSVSSNLSDMNLKSNSSGTYQVKLRGPYGYETLFWKLYNSKLSDFEYVIEIESIDFSDGKSYEKE